MHLTEHMPHRPRKQTPFMNHLRKNTTKGRIYVWSRNLRIFITTIYTQKLSSYRFPIPSSFFDVNQLEWIYFESIFILLIVHLFPKKRANSLSRRFLVGHSLIIRSPNRDLSPNVKFVKTDTWHISLLG